jgi:GAF domain-containing protein
MAESPSPRTGRTFGFPGPAAPESPAAPRSTGRPATKPTVRATALPAAPQPDLEPDPLSDLTLLSELTERLSSASDLESALRGVLQSGAAILGAGRGMLLLAENPGPHCSTFGTIESPGATIGFGLDRPALGALETVPRESGPYAGLLRGESRVIIPGPITETPAVAAVPALPVLPTLPVTTVPATALPTNGGSANGGPANAAPGGTVLPCGGAVAAVPTVPAIPGTRFREVAAHLGIGASYALPLTAPVQGGDPYGAVVWFYDTPTTPTERQQRLAGLYCSAASRLITKEIERDRLRRTAEALRRGLLPDRLPRVPGIQLAARCLPAGLDLSAGSDWYDALALPDSGLALSVGSVTGGGPDCAAAMGRIRAGLRAYAVLEGEDPVAVLGDLELLLKTTEPARTATALYVYLDPRSRQLSMAGAGQCPPLLVTSFGASFVETSLSAPLGMLSCWEAPGVELRADRGDLLLLYTEGLARRCGNSLHAGQAKLRSAAASAPREARQDPERFCAHLLSTCLDGSDGRAGDAPGAGTDRADDIVLLAARFE